MRHADSRTTLRYDLVRTNLDRHAAHAVAAYLAGMGADYHPVARHSMPASHVVRCAKIVRWTPPKQGPPRTPSS